MQQLTLKDKWLAFGAEIKTLPMCEYVAKISDIKTEMNALRNSVVLSDCSYVKKYAFDEVDGADFLDEKLAANILKLRYGKAMDTFLADENGNVAASITLVNIDDKILLFAEVIDEEAFKVLTSDNAQSLSDTHTMLSVDGPDAWKVAKKIFGADIFNIAFMAAEKYDFEGENAIVMRTGKASEFGYQILVPNSVSEKLFNQLKNEVDELGGLLAGVDTVLAARAKGNFFNIFAEGSKVKNPIELGIQWQIDFSKDYFCGAKAILAAREHQQNKLIAVTSKDSIEMPCNIFNGDNKVGEIVAVDASDDKFALALINASLAYVGQTFAKSASSEDCFNTVSRPAIIAESLTRGF